MVPGHSCSLLQWSHSSVGQSVRLITVRSAVQARVGPFLPSFRTVGVFHAARSSICGILPCPWLPGCPPGLPQGSPSASTKAPRSAPFCSESRQGAMHARNVEHSIKIKVLKGHARYVRGPRTSETRNIQQKSMFSRATHVSCVSHARRKRETVDKNLSFPDS